MDPDVGTVLLYAGLGVAVGLLGAPIVGARLRESLDPLAEDQIRARYVASAVVPQAVREGVGLVGVVAALLAGDSTWILIFAAASLGSQVMAFP